MPPPNILEIPVPQLGLYDAVDPAAPEFPDSAAPTLENLRVGRGVWQTRLGFTLQSSNLTSGEKQLLMRYYRANGDRYSIAAVAGTLYERKHDAGSWSAVTNGGSLYTSPTFGVYAFVTMKDYLYLSDRYVGAASSSEGKLKRISPTVGAEVVVQPASPSGSVTLYRCMRKVLEDWAGTPGSVPTNWVEDDSGAFDIQVAATTDESFDYPITPGNDPLGANRSAKLIIDSTGSNNDRVYRDESGTPAEVQTESDVIAFWGSQEVKRKIVSFDIGGDQKEQFSQIVDPEEAAEPFLWFFPVGSSLKNRQFKVRRVPNQERDLFVGRIVLPGRLSGQYRWRFTFAGSRDRTTESKPSTMTNGGRFEDFSHPQVSYTTRDSKSLEKCAVLVPNLTGGSVSATPYVPLYRNGGVPSLIKDAYGQDVWTLVRVTAFLSTTTAGALTGASSSTILVPTGQGAANLVEGDFLIIDPSSTQAYSAAASPSVGGWEVVKVLSVSVGGVNDTITIEGTVVKSHDSGVAIQTAFLDNTPDAVLDTTQQLEIERDDPPRSIHWLVRLPDGRMAAANFREDRNSDGTFEYERRLGVAISNLPTPFRRMDHEVFPNGVDPFTRRSPTQGFRFDIQGDQAGDVIMWMGLFQRTLTVLTQTALYQVFAYSQAQWSSTAVQKIADVGCIAGETVRQVDGLLLWAADGPRVMAWDGRGLPRDISRLRVSNTLRNAPSANWGEWHATPYADEDGSWYKLAVVPNGGSDPTLLLDFNLSDRWETTVYYDSGGTAIPLRMFSYWNGPGDVKELYCVEAGSGNGRVMRLENGSTDNSQVIRVNVKSKRFPMSMIVSATHAFFHAAAVTDTITLKIYAGGSEYGDVSEDYDLSLAGSGDRHLRQRLDFGLLKGLWLQAQYTGSFSNRPAPRDLEIWWTPIRFGRQGADDSIPS